MVTFGTLLNVMHFLVAVNLREIVMVVVIIAETAKEILYIERLMEQKMVL